MKTSALSSFGVSPSQNEFSASLMVSPLTPSSSAKIDTLDHTRYPTNTSYQSIDMEHGHGHSFSHSHDHSFSHGHDHDHDHHSHEYDDLLKHHSFARSECNETTSLRSFNEDYGHSHNHGHSHGHGKHADGVMRNSSIIAFWGALMVHSTVEGLGIGVTSDVEQFAIVFAILIHKVFESLALSGTLFDSKLTWTTKLVLFGSFCLSIPIGAVVGAVLKSDDAGNSLFSGIITGFASGSFM
jgi:zinc transporter ZupT